MLYGRAFELTTGDIILPCPFCGSPVWEPELHCCGGRWAELQEQFDQEQRDEWKTGGTA